MDLTHRFYLPASIDAAWAAFGRLEQIAPCFPGATITDVDGSDYAGFVKIKFGPVPLVYQGSATFTQRNEASRRMVVEARGQDRRGNGTAVATVTATFTEAGDLTEVKVRTDLSITGRPAQFGTGVVTDVSDRLLDLFVHCISARFRDGEFAGDLLADGQPTVELPRVDPDAGADTDFAAAGASTATDAYRPAGGAVQPHLQGIRTVVPVVLKRFWPALLVGGVLAAVAGRLLLRRRRG